MSIATNPRLSAFYRWLKTQPLPEDPLGRYTQQRLADEAMVGRTHLSQVLSGRLGGKHTWKRLVAVIPLEGLQILRQCSTWHALAEGAYSERLTSQRIAEEPLPKSRLIAEINKRYREKVLRTDLQRQKERCRWYAREYVKRGKLIRKACEKCGNPKSEMHHTDYSQPLEVRWLCRPCHRYEHKDD